MASLTSPTPTYISAHSADVILSDIRPVKLSQDALTCLNSILDEILANVILSAQSLVTDDLKSGLLRILSTPLGKEALLEAELELRAYWERTKTASPTTNPNESSNAKCHVQWAIELMRLKCEAYSTLNDSDEDSQMESKLSERMGKGDLGCSPALVVPAALYMTAILECICEHILSSVGRVATRDSSRTTASVSDLFVALCEDDSMYALFRTLKVYELVEFMSKPTKLRRAKSISSSQSQDRNNTPSPAFEPNPVSPRKDANIRKSMDSSTFSQFPHGQQQPRTSLEKVRGIKLFNKAHSRSGSDRDSQLDMHPVPRRIESAGSEPTRNGSISRNSDADNSVTSFGDEREQQFEDLVRSAGTMKMSLTPDRLRTMEAPRPSRNAGNGIRPTPHIGATPSRDEPPVAYPSARSSSLRPKLSQTSIREDEELKDSPGLPSAFPTSKRKTDPSSASGVARSRSISNPISLPSKPAIPPLSAPAGKPSTFSPSSTTQRDSRPPSRTMVTDDYGIPKKTRKLQRHRESMDLDEVMNGLDDDDVRPLGQKLLGRSNSSIALNNKSSPARISQSARDLIAFLDEGPPEDPFQPLLTPSTVSLSRASTKSNGKGSSRLQRMLSKLSIGASETSRRSDSPMSAPPTTPSFRPPPPMPVAVMPVPPRIKPAPPTLISPPESPIDHVNQISAADRKSPAARRTTASTVDTTGVSNNLTTPRSSSRLTTSSPSTPAASSYSQQPTLTTPQPPPQKMSYHSSSGTERGSFKTEKVDLSSINGVNGVVHVEKSSRVERPQQPEIATPVPTLASPPLRRISACSRTPIQPDSPSSEKRLRKITPPISEPEPPSINQAIALDMRSMLSKATSADECRLLVDMFMVRSGFSLQSIAKTPEPELKTSAQKLDEPDPLEGQLIELFLGESSDAQLWLVMSQDSEPVEVSTVVDANLCEEKAVHPPQQSSEDEQSSASQQLEHPQPLARPPSTPDTPRALTPHMVTSPTISISA